MPLPVSRRIILSPISLWSQATSHGKVHAHFLVADSGTLDRTASGKGKLNIAKCSIGKTNRTSADGETLLVAPAAGWARNTQRLDCVKRAGTI